MKIGLIIIGALIGPFAGFFAMFYVYGALPHRGCGVTRMGEAIVQSLFIGAPLGLITFCLIGLWLGRLLVPRAKDNVATRDESVESKGSMDRRGD
jgi:hypothetical protein